jgi:ligand-binding sensor domain-containing protein
VGNIPLGPVNVIREDPTSARILYVGTDTGVYVSHDGGVSWEVLGANLPSVYVHDLIVHPRDKVIVIATHGRGMWAIDAVPVESYKGKGTN